MGRILRFHRLRHFFLIPLDSLEFINISILLFTLLIALLLVCFRGISTELVEPNNVLFFDDIKSVAIFIIKQKEFKILDRFTDEIQKVLLNSISDYELQDELFLVISLEILSKYFKIKY